MWLLGQQLPLLLQQLSSLLTTSLRPILPKQQQQMQQGGQQQTVPTHQRQPSMGRGETSVNITSPGDRLTGSLSFEAESITRSVRRAQWAVLRNNAVVGAQNKARQVEPWPAVEDHDHARTAVEDGSTPGREKLPLHGRESHRELFRRPKQVRVTREHSPGYVFSYVYVH